MTATHAGGRKTRLPPRARPTRTPYHRAMLRWLLIVTMALLPWHGWAGASLVPALSAAPTAILGSVDCGPVAAIEHHADPANPSADCAEHAARHSSDDGPQHAADAGNHHAAAGGADGGCPGCSMCHSCSPVGLPAMAGIPPADAASAQRPAAGESRFASAEGAAGLKPPIS